MRPPNHEHLNLRDKGRIEFLSMRELRRDLPPRQKRPLPKPIGLYLIVVIGVIATLILYFYPH